MSVITSWRIEPANTAAQSGKAPPGLRMALENGISLVDLYFLPEEDVRYYRAWLPSREDLASNDPQAFAAALRDTDVARIAEKLKEALAECYQGKLVGRRPRIAALATNFPDASSLKSKKRGQAVKALRNSLRLAQHLGCHCVEIVGGSAVPDGPRESSDLGPEKYATARLRAFATSLVQMFADHVPAQADGAIAKQGASGIGRIPYVALELEPGDSFLLNSLGRIRSVFLAIRRASGASAAKQLAIKQVHLNLDVAHAYLIGITARDMKLPWAAREGAVGSRSKAERWSDRVAHMHVSDHAGHTTLPPEGDFGGNIPLNAIRVGTHSADLEPGAFHTRGHFTPWLELAFELTQHPESRFSGVVAVELEARQDIAVVQSSMNRVRQWLNSSVRSKNETAGKLFSAPCLHGAILAIDIGNSTQTFFGSKAAQRPHDLISLLEKLCRGVLRAGGSIMSFTGDGFIALFEAREFESDLSAARQASRSVLGMLDELMGSLTTTGLTYRAALHWGEVLVPTSGALRDQAIGRDVVLTTRLCAWIADYPERGIPPETRGVVLAATGTFVQQFTGGTPTGASSTEDVPNLARAWRELDSSRAGGTTHVKWSNVSFKGLGSDSKTDHEVYVSLIDPKKGP